MKIYTRQQIESVVDREHLLPEIEKGFVSYSQNRMITAEASSLKFTTPPADVHIKSGFMIDDQYYVIKIASGFYDNPKIGLESSNGLMLLFSKVTGQLQAILLDEGKLTDLRTGLAGAIAAKYLAKRSLKKIGIIGTGVQAREQLYCLQFVTKCRDVLVWGRDSGKASLFASDQTLSSFKITPADTIEKLASECDLIVTTTPSSTPLLFGYHLKPGTHVTAVGADQEGKQELDKTVFKVADRVVLDSFSQCSKYGDFSHAKHLKHQSVVELGALILNPVIRSDTEITLIDLTGIAAQDLQIAKAIYEKLSEHDSRHVASKK